MFLLGHMCWGFVSGKGIEKLIGSRHKISAANPNLLMLVAILPDFDFFLGGFRVEHRTWAHSIFIWSILFTPFFMKFRMSVVPYFVAVLQHMLFGDAIVGLNTPFWPITDSSFGLQLDSLSIQNVAAEELGLCISFAWLLLDKKTRYSFIHFDSSKFGLAIRIVNIAALVSFVASIYYYAPVLAVLNSHGIIERATQLEKNAAAITKSALFPIEISMHFVLAGVVILSIFINFIQSLLLRRGDREQIH